MDGLDYFSNSEVSSPEETSNKFEDPFAYAVPESNAGNADEGGLDCEIKMFEARYNSAGERRVLQVGKKLDAWREGHPRNSMSTLIFIRFYDHDMELEKTELRIQSPHLKQALREVVREYPGMNMHGYAIVIRDLPRCFFHYWKEFAEYGSKLRDPVAVQHLVFALQYMYRILQSQISSYFNLMESPKSSPGLEFSNLWMAFRPGEPIYYRHNNRDRVLRFKSMDLTGHYTRCCGNQYWKIEGESLDYDGTDFGLRTESIMVPFYDDYRPLTQLRTFPLEFHSEKRTLGEALVLRGKKFVSLRGIHHLHYEGLVEALSPFRRNTLYGEEDEFPLQTLTVKGRVIVDCNTFRMAKPSHAVHFGHNVKVYRTDADDHTKLVDGDFLVCAPSMPGFCFSNKRWCYFDIDNLRDIDFNTDAFEKLILPSTQKEMINSMVKVNANERLVFDDVIKGKGKGMVFLLHGTAGVGKTLTAESVADYTRQPLYVVSCSDLGVDVMSVEQNLSAILQLSMTWNAIVLLDEADVFLEQRTAHDLERNGLVSVFLRVLEYFEGILFLTTNRINHFDTAFKSRIHLAIYFPALDFNSRRELWKASMEKAITQVECSWFDGGTLDILAADELNGRQIKNVVKTAHAMAIGAGTSLQMTHLQNSFEALKEFDVDMGGEDLGSASAFWTHETSRRTKKRHRVE